MAKSERFPAFMRVLGLLIALLLILIASLRWMLETPHTIAALLAHTSFADARATQAEAVVLAHVPQKSAEVILYLNPDDIGDNFYRLRYALYPIQFVPYWSWTNPNQGGRVWTIPEFTTVQGLTSTMLKYHVDYVLAVSGPNLLDFLHRSHAHNYLFQVDASKLAAGKGLAQSLVEVDQWS